MNEEIKELLNDLNNKEVTVDDLTHNDKTLLLGYIAYLQKRVDQYENPNDLTLFYMWLDEKAKDKMKQLEQENERLERKYNQRENKWEKWATEKQALCNETSKYLCKYQNVKREYAKQNKVITDYKSRNEKAIEDIQKLIDDINNKTIIGLNNFIPKLEVIQDELAQGSDNNAN